MATKSKTPKVIVDARKIAVSENTRTRVAGCGDPARIDRWLVQAATCVDAAAFAKVIEA